MAFKISATIVVNDSAKAICASLNPGTSASNPVSPSQGDIYYDTSFGAIFVYTGTAWVAQN